MPRSRPSKIQKTSEAPDGDINPGLSAGHAGLWADRTKIQNEGWGTLRAYREIGHKLDEIAKKLTEEELSKEERSDLEKQQVDLQNEHQALARQNDEINRQDDESKGKIMNTMNTKGSKKEK